MSEWATNIQAQIKELREAIEGLHEENRRAGIVKRDELAARRAQERSNRFFVSVPGLLYDAVGSASPVDAEYLVKTANSTLTAERVVTDTASITWDWGTSGQAKANVVKSCIFQASNITGVANTAYVADSSGGIRTIQLPGSPAAGEWMFVRRAGANNVIVPRNGKLINNAASDDTLTADGDARRYFYESTNGSWWTF